MIPTIFTQKKVKFQKVMDDTSIMIGLPSFIAFFRSPAKPGTFTTTLANDWWMLINQITVEGRSENKK